MRYGHRARAGGNLDEEIYTLTRDEGFSEKVKRRITAGNFFLLEESVCCNNKIFKMLQLYFDSLKENNFYTLRTSNTS